MRTAGFAPALGASGSLVAASVVVALLASALLAFHDWPSGAPRPGTGTATLPAAASPASHRTAAVERGEGTSTGRRRTAARPARRSARTALRSAAGTGRGQAPVRASAPATTSPKPATQAPARGASPPAATQPAPAPTQAPAPGGPVGRTVHTVRKAVDPVVQRLPAPVQAPVNAVRTTVQQVGDRVDGALGRTGIRLP